MYIDILENNKILSSGIDFTKTSTYLYDMEVFLCEICNKEFNNGKSRMRHYTIAHNINPIDTYIKDKCDGIRPTCECGCGYETKYMGYNVGFRKFISGHNSSVGVNNFQIRPEIKEKSAKTQKENWKNGKYKGWWENDNDETKQKIEGIKEKLRNDKERGEKISKSLTGVKKSDEHKQSLSESAKKRYDENPEVKIKMSETRLRWMRDNSKVKSSKLEIIFEQFLIDLGVIYERNFLVTNIKTFFDFYIPLQNTIIEVDGDFYHCNPNSKFKDPQYPIQYKNLGNDKRKNTWCNNHNITLLRYWEKDIKERPEWVMSDLKEKLNII